MVNIHAVAGLNFGDEGKGRYTHWLSDEDSTVIKHNGGAQAGHTVVTEDGARIIHNQVGSGASKGAETHLSDTFLVNPLFLLAEMDEFYSVFKRWPRISVHPNASVVFESDMFMNQMFETSRGKKRHGSCGHGINETVVRREAGLNFTFGDLIRGEDVDSFVRNQLVPWYERRAAANKLAASTEIAAAAAAKMQKLHEVVDRLRCLVTQRRSVDHRGRSKIIYESGQGIGLTQANMDEYPHLTRSDTDFTNVARDIKRRDYGTDVKLDVHLVTRPYVTRHGNGRLPFEVTDSCERYLPSFSDKTNVPNEWQGSIRVGLLCDDAVKRYASALDSVAVRGLAISNTVAFTCMDHANSYFYGTGEMFNSDYESVLKLVHQKFDNTANVLTFRSEKYSDPDPV